MGISCGLVRMIGFSPMSRIGLMFLLALNVLACTPRAYLVAAQTYTDPGLLSSVFPSVIALRSRTAGKSRLHHAGSLLAGQSPVGFPVLHTRGRRQFSVATRKKSPARFEEHDLNWENDALSLTTGCHTELYDCCEEEVPESSDEQDHNMWNDALNFITDYHTGLCIQLCFGDEELGRAAISCHFAVDCLCAELYAF